MSQGLSRIFALQQIKITILNVSLEIHLEQSIDKVTVPLEVSPNGTPLKTLYCAMPVEKEWYFGYVSFV